MWSMLAFIWIEYADTEYVSVTRARGTRWDREIGNDRDESLLARKSKGVGGPVRNRASIVCRHEIGAWVLYIKTALHGAASLREP
jgi:hypothetical protein